MTAEPDSIAPAVATPGAQWRTAAWIILALNALIVYLLLGIQGQERHGFDIIAAAVFVSAFFTLIGLTFVGIGCGAIAARQASRHGDRRFVVVLPVFGHVLLLMAALGALSAGR